jgi:hypothetical protein
MCPVFVAMVARLPPSVAGLEGILSVFPLMLARSPPDVSGKVAIVTAPEITPGCVVLKTTFVPSLISTVNDEAMAEAIAEARALMLTTLTLGIP